MNKMITLSWATRIAGVATVLFGTGARFAPVGIIQYLLLMFSVSALFFMGYCASLKGEKAELFGTTLGRLPGCTVVGIVFITAAVCTDLFVSPDISDSVVQTVVKALEYLSAGFGCYAIFSGLMTLCPEAGDEA